MTALERAMEMMQQPMAQLPPLALAFAKYTCNRIGMCGEVLLTCWAVYAQEIENLPCEDDLYLTRDDDRQWFLDNRCKPWRIENGRVVCE